MDLRSMLWGWDWGSVPEWFGAVGTIAAVVVALAASWSSKAQLHQEREAAASERQEAAEDRQRFREQHDREMSEARRRAASRISLTEERYDGEMSHLLRARQWVVRNAGEEAIRAVQLVALDEGNPEGPALWASGL